MTQETENQNKDVLTEFKDQYVNSDKFNKIQVPFNEPLMFVEIFDPYHLSTLH